MSEQSSSHRKMEQRFCYCGKGTVRRTSWTDRNLGRRFLSCKSPKEKGGCNFFLSADPPMYGRSVQIIPGLLR
ncbi:hypothetical protein CDL12_24730 [Handroanthus impetiginosus]|uniref:GRF-type domain-containing protein n=1 Tax=Handroanthus impetiginosus TaxID=429701 RepID=A0A2G9GBU2_9LAMI|nr:hypothetical protein CDL12_24730 [Handroanthus impetiginosus]